MPERGSIVADSGPLIALALIEHLDLLQQLFGNILVPQAVFREVVLEGVGRPGAHEIATAQWVARVDLQPPPDRLLLEELEIGEAEAITLAVRSQASLILLDERRGRRIAEMAYGLRVRGTIGILIMAKQSGLVSSIRPLLEALRSRGNFISSELIDIACQEAGE